MFVAVGSSMVLARTRGAAIASLLTAQADLHAAEDGELAGEGDVRVGRGTRADVDGLLPQPFRCLLRRQPS